MKIEEFTKAKKLLEDIEQIDKQLSYIKNKHDNFISTSYREDNIILRASIIIDKELKDLIIKHLSDKKENKLNEFKAI